MPDFQTDNNDIERALEALCNEIKELGGSIHDNVIIGADGGDFFVRAPARIANGAPIISLPREALLPLDQFTLQLEGDDLAVAAQSADLSSARRRLMETILTLYNLTGKVAAHKQVDIMQLHYRDSELFKKLLYCRGYDKITFDYDPAEEQSRFHADSFLNTRKLRMKIDAVSDEGERVILPVIDFLNHHALAHSPEPRNGGQAGVSVVKSTPVAGSDICYMRYGGFDAFDCLLGYGYVEQNCPFARSAPLKFILEPFGELRIKSARATSVHKNLPASLHDIARDIPHMRVDSKARIAEIDFIHIPQENSPRGLRRVLKIVLDTIAQKFGVTISKQELTRAIRVAEHRIIEHNHKLYMDFEAFLAEHDATPGCELLVENVKTVIGVQRASIEKYPFFENAMAYRETTAAP